MAGSKFGACQLSARRPCHFISHIRPSGLCTIGPCIGSVDGQYSTNLTTPTRQLVDIACGLYCKLFSEYNYIYPLPTLCSQVFPWCCCHQHLYVLYQRSKLLNVSAKDRMKPNCPATGLLQFSRASSIVCYHACHLPRLPFAHLLHTHCCYCPRTEKTFLWFLRTALCRILAHV